MPRNPQKARCSYPGCRAWARKGSPFCQAHRPRLQANTLPEDSRDEAGFYGRLFTREELAVLAQKATMVPSLASEIGMLKVLIRRVVERNGDPAETLKLVGRAVDQLARAWRVERAISGEAAEGLASAMAQVLDELSVELGIKL